MGVQIKGRGKHKKGFQVQFQHSSSAAASFDIILHSWVQVWLNQRKAFVSGVVLKLQFFAPACLPSLQYHLWVLIRFILLGFICTHKNSVPELTTFFRPKLSCSFPQLWKMNSVTVFSCVCTKLNRMSLNRTCRSLQQRVEAARLPMSEAHVYLLQDSFLRETEIRVKSCLTTLPKERDPIPKVLRQWWKKHRGIGGKPIWLDSSLTQEAILTEMLLLPGKLPS